MIEGLLQPNTLKFFFTILISLFLFSLIYWIFTNTKAVKLHLQNEKTVAQKLETGELQITTKESTDDKQ